MIQTLPDARFSYASHGAAAHPLDAYGADYGKGQAQRLGSSATMIAGDSPIPQRQRRGRPSGDDRLVETLVGEFVPFLESPLEIRTSCTPPTASSR
jgi:hypothetical protein